MTTIDDETMKTYDQPTMRRRRPTTDRRPTDETTKTDDDGRRYSDVD
jgi:hypothetical protein